VPIKAPVMETPASIGVLALVSMPASDQAVADHALMHAEIAAVEQQAQDRTGNGARR
jgi:hypothetical protein